MSQIVYESIFASRPDQQRYLHNLAAYSHEGVSAIIDDGASAHSPCCDGLIAWFPWHSWKKINSTANGVIIGYIQWPVACWLANISYLVFDMDSGGQEYGRDIS